MGFGDILKKLDEDGNGFDLGDLKNIAHLDFGELLSGDFLQSFTKFGSMQELLSKAGVSKPEDLAKADPAMLDGLIREHSSFGGWQELLAAAKDKFVK